MLVTFVRSSFREKCRIDSTSSMDFIVWPWEAEWKVISHASLLTILDVARQDHMQRAGFLRLLFKNRWFCPVASIHVAFKRPILRFHRLTVVTRIPYWNHKDILIEHQVVIAGTLMATAIVRGVIKKGRETVDPRTVVAQLGGGEVDEAALARLESLVAVERAYLPASAESAR
jgi:acyl-CoA thioesterase FadM